MSHINYNFLTESFLFGGGVENNYKDHSDSQILNELGSYREFVLSHLDSIRTEISEIKQKIAVTVESFGNRPDEDTLKQLVLYMDCILIEDPLFSMTETKSNSSKVMTQYLGMTEKEEFDRNALVDAVRYMKDNTRLIVCNFIKFIPISLLHEAPKEIPIVYDENGFRKSLPKHISEYLIKKLDVRNIVQRDGYLTVQFKQKLQKGTGIYLFFPDSQDRSGEIVFYQKMEKIKVDENSNHFLARFYIPDHISQHEFDIWLDQSKHRAALQFFNETLKEYSLAASFGCMYLTKSLLRSDLLSMMWDRNSVTAEVANLSMGLNLPVLQNIGIADIIEIREKYGESFKNFRTDLGKELIKLRSVDSTDELKIKLADLSYEINDTNINEIDRELRRIKNSFGVDLAITAASLVTSYIGSINGSVAGNTLAAAGIATGAFSVLKDTKSSIKDYLNLKSKPGYFLWKMQGKPWNMR